MAAAAVTDQVGRARQAAFQGEDHRGTDLTHSLGFGRSTVVFSRKDLDAKVFDLQPCIASCDENLARSLDRRSYVEPSARLSIGQAVFQHKLRSATVEGSVLTKPPCP